jgi:PAS domain S-box-containing protein
MRFLKNLSIRRKQTLIMMLTSTITLLLVCAAFVGVEALNFRAELTDEVSTMAQIAGNNCTAALDFNDPRAAEDTLGALRAEPPIASAYVYDRQGEVFAVYQRDGKSARAGFPPVQPPGHEFRDNQLRIFLPITMQGEKAGTIYVACDLYEFDDRLKHFAVTALLVLGISLLAAFFLSMRLQRVVSGPVLQLAQAVRMVAQEKDYSVRATKRSNDELGQLVDGFNEMLAQIQQRDAALQSVRADLERRVVERTTELAESQSLYHSLVDQMPAGVFRKDAEGRYVFVNSLFCQLKGMKTEEILGKTPGELAIYEESKTELGRPSEIANRQRTLAIQGADHHELIMRMGKPIEIEEVYTQPNGAPHYFQAIKSPVFAHGGKIIGTQGILFDITLRRQAEESLRLLSSAVEQSKESIVITDAELDLPGPKIIFVNPAFTQMTGYTAEEAIGKTPRILQGPLTDKIVLSRLRQNLERGEAFVGEAINYRKDGKEFNLEWQIAPLRDACEKLTHFVAIQRDITERKLVEAKLAYERDLLRTLLENTADHIYFKDLQSRFVRFSQGMLKLFNLAHADELNGRTDFDFFSEEHARPAFEAEQEIIRTGKPILNLEEKETHNDGRVTWASTSKMAWRDQTGNVIGTVGISRNITDHKQLEGQLLQSQKMETVGKLAGGFAHEFNSILTAILGQSELLLGDLPAGNPLIKNATEINKAASRAATLTRQLLAYGRKQFLQPESLDLNRVVTGMENMLRHLLGSDVNTQIIPAAGLHLVKADAGQIEQVIMNMVINARDAMPNGGKLILETANVSFDLESVGRYPELKPGNYVMLAITDTGTGMSEEVKARVFDPFFSTKGVGEGTGLGLSTCYGIAKQSGGHISVYSELGRGTTFKIYLPQVEQQAKIFIPRLDSPDLPRGTENILLVEDDPALREMAATLLRRLGYAVLSAANGIEALSLKHEPSTGHIDLLFTDVVMPHMSGKELADRVRALYPATKILFTSAYTENAIVHQGVLDKGVALLQKPFTPSTLAHKIRQVLDQPSAPEPDNAQDAFGFTKTSDGRKIP